MKTLIIGLGNPILGDDGVGWVVAEQVEKALDKSRPSFTVPPAASPTAPLQELEDKCEVEFASLGGLSLMERLTSWERVILIDSIFTGTKLVGTVSQFSLEELPDLTSGHSASVHDTSLHNALKVGRSMQIELPDDENVTVIAIEAKDVYDFSQELSPAVSAAVPQAVKMVLDLLDGQKL
jgi:hydrogenase maturation protease